VQERDQIGSEANENWNSYHFPSAHLVRCAKDHCRRVQIHILHDPSNRSRNGTLLIGIGNMNAVADVIGLADQDEKEPFDVLGAGSANHERETKNKTTDRREEDELKFGKAEQRRIDEETA